MLNDVWECSSGEAVIAVQHTCLCPKLWESKLELKCHVRRPMDGLCILFLSKTYLGSEAVESISWS